MNDREYAQALASIVQQMGQFGGNADLTRAQRTYNENGEYMTPVTTYGGIGGAPVGNFMNDGSMTPEQLSSYAKAVMGGMPDTRQLQVGSIGQGQQVGQMPNGTPINNTIDTDRLYQVLNAYANLQGR